SLVVAGEEFCVGILGFRNLDGDGLARNVAVGLGQDVERMLGPPPVAVSVPGHSVGGLQACFGWGLGVFIARPLTGSWIEQEGTVPAATPDSPLAIDGRHPAPASQFLWRLQGVDPAAARIDPRKLAVGAKPDDALRIRNDVMDRGRESRTIGSRHLVVGDGPGSPVDSANTPVRVWVEIVGKPDVPVEIERAVHRMMVADVE